MFKVSKSTLELVVNQIYINFHFCQALASVINYSACNLKFKKLGLYCSHTSATSHEYSYTKGIEP
jgi:hypothetical protein